MKKIICSDTGRNAPEEITDRGESIKEVTTLLEEIADKAREARIEEHDEEDKERSKEEDKKNIYDITDEDRKNKRLLDFERSAKEVKKETKGIFVDKEFLETVDGPNRIYNKWTNTRSPHQHLRIPFSWHQELKRTYRGDEVVYTDAVLVLSFIVFCYRREFTSRMLLRIRSKELKSLFDISKQKRNVILSHLEEEDLIERVLVKGITPWHYRSDTTPGTYLYVVPRPKSIRSITYNMRLRFSGV